MKKITELNARQTSALKQAQKDVIDHWSALMNTTPAGINRMLESEEFGAKFGSLFNATVLEVLDEVYGGSL